MIAGYTGWICGRTGIDPPLSITNEQALFHPLRETFISCFISAQGHKIFSLSFPFKIKIILVTCFLYKLISLLYISLSLIVSTLIQRACSFGPSLSKFSQNSFRNSWENTAKGLEPFSKDSSPLAR